MPEPPAQNETATVPQEQYPLQSSVNSNSSARSGGSVGPSNKEPAMITSTWKIGWQTPTLMISCYVLALMTAIAHLLLFRYIDGKEASGPNRIAPQSYVTTASNILSNAFGFSLRASVAVAFVQYLWHLLRKTAMKVSTIELLFTIRTNVFMLFHVAALKSAPILCIMAILIWGLQVAPSFPPGAITVTTTQRILYDDVTVPTFNASFMGNGSGTEANLYSLANLHLAEVGSGFAAIGTQGTKHSSLLQRVAFPVLVKGETFSTPSPCGGNCSYSVEFEGPYLKCDNHTSTLNQSKKQYPIYQGRWFDNRNTFRYMYTYNGTYSIANYNSTTLTPLTMNTTDGSVTLRQDDLFCLPGRAKFTVNNTYINNVQTRTVKSEPIERLVNLSPLTYDAMVSVPGFSATGSYSYGTGPANWSAYALDYYRDVNHLTIIGSMMYYVQGFIYAAPEVSEESDSSSDSNSAATNGLDNPDSTVMSNNVIWGQREYQNASSETNGQCLSSNNSLIDTTRFNANFGHFQAAEPANMVFNITQDVLNEHLLNLTLSMMQAFGTWNTTVNATRLETVTIYSFSEPLNLILPYFISLAVAIPFIIIGAVALIKNGVSAIDSSFMQIIATSTGSAVLDRAAAGGCLGGDESLPKELKDLKIRFGEIIDRDEPGRIRRAAFGVDGEITTLKKGASYGIARWI